MSAVDKCAECGAPLEDGLAACRHCNVVVVGRVSGIDCPACGELAVAGRSVCAACGASFFRGCLFCGASSHVTVVACGGCAEAFEGAQERKTAREEAAKQQQVMGLAQQGLSVLGQAVGTPSGRDILGGLLDAVLKSNDRK